MTVRVPFTWANVRTAALAGVDRNIDGLRIGREGAYGNPNTSFQPDIDGCIGELAVAKYYGVEDEWIACAYNWLPPTDVGKLQVRATAHMDGHLPLHDPQDRDADPFVFVTYSLRREPVVLLRGWILAGDGKLKKYWGEFPGQKGRPCFKVPQSVLHPIETLPVSELLPDWLR